MPKRATRDERIAELGIAKYEEERAQELLDFESWRQQVIQLYAQGLAAQDVSSLVGVGRETINYWVRCAGITRSRQNPTETTRRRMSEVHKGKSESSEARRHMAIALRRRFGPGTEYEEGNLNLARLYLDGHNVQELCSITGLTETLIRYRLKRVGVALRPKILSPEHKCKLSLAHKGKSLSRLHREKIGLGNRGKKLSEQQKQRMSVTKRIRCSAPAFRAKMSRIRMGSICSPETRRKLSIITKKQFQDPAQKVRASKIHKELWLDPEFVSKVIAGLQIRPTKPELEAQSILDRHFPEFKYNGDFRLGVTLNGMIPDFVNVNGKKEVIEIFGNYWHSPKMARTWREGEMGRTMAYGSLGYRCLVIWEGELSDTSAVVNKISTWVNRNGKRR